VRGELGGVCCSAVGQVLGSEPVLGPPNPAVAVNSGRARCLSDVACGFTFISSWARRSRIPARRERVYVIDLVKRWIWSVLGFGKIRQSCRTRTRSLPGRRSGCVTRTTLRGQRVGNHYTRSNTTPYSGFMLDALPAKNLATRTRLANCRPICASHVSTNHFSPVRRARHLLRAGFSLESGSIISSLIFRT
jgi:hypothetical protein